MEINEQNMLSSPVKYIKKVDPKQIIKIVICIAILALIAAFVVFVLVMGALDASHAGSPKLDALKFGGALIGVVVVIICVSVIVLSIKELRISVSRSDCPYCKAPQFITGTEITHVCNKCQQRYKLDL